MRSSARFLALVNLVFVVLAFVFYIPARAISGRHIDRALASGDVKEIKVVVDHFVDSQYDYGVLFLVCFVLLIANSVFLWRLTKVSSLPSNPISN